MPPEVILDRYVRIHLRNEPGFSHYLGKLDIEQVESPSFRSFLYVIQETMKEALRLEGVNASGGVDHPPFHFDYLDAGLDTMNAHAFQHGGFSFITLTLPMVALVWHLSHELSRSLLVLQRLGVHPDVVDPDEMQGLLFQIQMNFVVSHEYTHHVHRHCASKGLAIEMWTEFQDDAACGNLTLQAHELNADSYAAYIVLAHLLRGERRQSALALLNRRSG